MTLQPKRKVARAVPPPAPSRGEHEDGYVLLAVLVMLLLVMLTLSIAAPKVATDLRRDKETEAVQRGKQYIRAIRLYYRKNGTYPNTIDQLMNTGGAGQRFLRKRYLDPMTGKDDWRLIHVGEAHVSSTGFFGQPSAQVGTPIGGTPGSSPGASPYGSSGSSPFGSPSSGSSGSSPFGSSSSGSSGSSPFGSPSSGSSGSSPFGSPSSGSSGSSPFGSPSSSSSAGTSSPYGASGTGTGTGTTGNSAFGSPGATFGGAPIVGIGLPINKTSIKTYKKQTRYNLWEFVYDPSQELAAAAGLTGGGGITPTGAGSGTTGTTPGIGGGNSPISGPGGNSGFSGGGFNSGNGFGGSPGSNGNPGMGNPGMGNPGGAMPPASPTNPPGNTF